MALAAALAAVALLMATLARYRSRAAEARTRTGPVYLSDERAALPPARKLAAARVQPRRPAATRSERAFSYAAAAQVFEAPTVSRPWEQSSAEAGADAPDVLASDEILVRAFGRPQGDFVFHRTRGWLRFDGTTWVPVAPQDLPPELAAEFPETVSRNAGSAPTPAPVVAGLGTDGGADWLATLKAPAEAEAGAR